jgi:cell wall-associated NlpC family hydrolase
MADVNSVITWGQKEIGQPYVWGGEEPGGFDCSGLMQYIFAQVGIKLPRTAAQQQSWATPVSSPAAGDLVFWGRPATHVALYIGGGKIIQAPHAGASVEQVSLWGSPASYGRVPGLGGILAAPVALGATAVGWTGQQIGNLLGGARTIAVEGVFGALGLALLGYGLYRIAKPTLKGMV